MKTEVKEKIESTLAHPLAPEDVQCGDYVSILNENVEFPACLLPCSDSVSRSDDMIRFRMKSTEGGIPFLVKSICLPFVCVRTPKRQIRMLDLRKVQLVRLSPEYGDWVSRAMNKKSPEIEHSFP